MSKAIGNRQGAGWLAVGLIGAAFTCLATSPAWADAKVEMENVGSCLAYAFVRNGFDGKNEIPAEKLPGLNALKDEYMFRSASVGLSEEDAQKFVVNALVQQNSLKAEHGVEALDAQFQVLCTNIASTLMVKPQ